MFDNKNDGKLKSAMRKSISAPTITSSSSTSNRMVAVTLPEPQQSRRESAPTEAPTPGVARNANFSTGTTRSSTEKFKAVDDKHDSANNSGDGQTLMFKGDELDDDDQQDLAEVPFAGPGNFSQSTIHNDDMDHEAEDDEGSDMDMDETTVYGGILRRESIVTVVEADITADMSEDMSIVTASSTDEEKTMDFTVAVGGLLPRSPPKHAARNRSSIGYSLPESPDSIRNRIRPGETLEGDPSEEEDVMEETQAFGGIMGDDTMSTISEQSVDGHEKTMTFSFGDISAAAHEAAERALAEEQQQQDDDQDEDEDDEGGMSMTMAHGGILSHQSPASGLSQSLTRPSANAPSFARPTLSSSQRSREPTPKKRNVFAPSPSPNKQSSTPRNGMEVAGEVAKRLSFGSVTSSASKKRPSSAMDDLADDNTAKRSKLSSSTNVFAPQPAAPSAPVAPRVNIFAQGLSKSTSAPTAAAPPAINLSASVPATRILSPVKQVKRVSIVPSPAKPRQSLAVAAPRVSLVQPPKSPRRSVNVARTTTPQRLPPKSPGKSPALRRMLGENVHQRDIEAAERMHDGMEAPTISLSRFLELVGVEFMENLPKVQRKSLANGLGHQYPMSSGKSLAPGG